MKKIEADSFLDFKYLSSPCFSPDGKNAAFMVRNAKKDRSGYEGDIYLVQMKDRSIRKITGSKDVSYFCWEKDNSLIFPSSRNKDISTRREKGEAVTAFYRLCDNMGDAEEAFVIPLLVKDIEAMGEEKYLLLASCDENYPCLEGLSEKEKDEALKKYKNPPHREITELPMWGNGEGFISKKRNALFIYDSKNGSLKKITEDKFRVTGFKRGFGKIAVQGGIFDALKFRNPGLYIYDIEKDSTSCIFKPDEYKSGAFDFLDENTLILALTEGGKFKDQEYCDFYKVDINSKKLTMLAPYDYCIGRSSVGSDSRLGGGNAFKVENKKAYFITQTDESAVVKSIDEKGNIKDVYMTEGSVDSFDIYNKKLVLCAMDNFKLDELYDEKGNQLTFFNDKFMEEHEISMPEKYKFTASDGYEIRGWAIKPVGFKEGKKYPCILNVHGGPRSAFGNVYFNEMQLWASHGFFVIYCNPRGSDGRGGDFGYITGKYGTVDYDNLMEFTDEMIKKYPEIDKDRLGIAGGSYGGFMTNWVIGHTERFKAAVSQRSIADWISFEHTTDIGYYFCKEQMGVNTREDAEALWNFSPLKYADKVKTPTLFIHSDNDYRCYMAEGLSMFTSLKMFGVPSKLCLFKNENHDLSRSGRPKNRIRRMEEILSWMEKYLSSEEEK